MGKIFDQFEDDMLGAQHVDSVRSSFPDLRSSDSEYASVLGTDILASMRPGVERALVKPNPDQLLDATDKTGQQRDERPAIVDQIVPENEEVN